MGMHPRLKPLPDIEHMSAAELRALHVEVYGLAHEYRRQLDLQREEIARLKNLPKRPKVKPSGMEKGAGKGKKEKGKRPAKREATKPKLTINEVKIIDHQNGSAGRIELPWIHDFRGSGSDHSETGPYPT